MKKTIKSLIVGLVLTTVANGQKSLNLRDIEMLFENAVQVEAGKIFNSVAKLKLGYADALRTYRKALVAKRDINSVATIAAVDVELRNMSAVAEGSLKELVQGADLKMKTFRATYDRELALIMDKGDRQAKVLREVLIEQLKRLKENLAKEGNVEGALAVHEKLAKLGVGVIEDTTDSSDPLNKKSMVLTKEFGGYASAVSKQKLRLEQGAEYTLTFLVKLGDKELNEHDCLPRFYREEGEPDFRGGDKNKMRIAQRLSEKVKVSNSLDGWDKITVKFTHAYDEPVVLGVEFYDSEDIMISLRDFTLTDSEGKNLITKNLNAVSGWVEGEFNTFTK